MEYHAVNLTTGINVKKQALTETAKIPKVSKLSLWTDKVAALMQRTGTKKYQQQPPGVAQAEKENAKAMVARQLKIHAEEATPRNLASRRNKEAPVTANQKAEKPADELHQVPIDMVKD